MQKVFYLKTCGTCTKILKQFDLNRWELREIKTEPITEEELKSIKLPYFEWSDDNENRLGYKFDNLGDIYFEKKKD